MRSPLRLSLVILLFCAFLPYTSVRAVNLITNGDFQTGNFTGWMGSAPSANFFVGTIPPLDSGGHDTLGATFGSAPPGNFYSLSQDIATTPGAFYNLSFFYVIGQTPAAPTINGGAGPDNHFQAFFNGVMVFDNANSIPGFSTEPFNNLMATGSTTTVLFKAFNNFGFDYLDDVVVTAAPAPESGSSFMIFGLALLALAAFRRSRLFHFP